MTLDELNELLDQDWNDAVDAFNPPQTEDDNEDAFQDALREMVRDLQRLAFNRGYEESVNNGVHLDISLDVGQSKEIVKAMLNDTPITLSLVPFE